MSYHDILSVALDAARAAAGIHQKHLGHVQQHEWTAKGGADFVSHVDHEAEAAIVQRIRSAFPDHVIMAEEAAGELAAADWTGAEWLWLVDPLDGTTNFLHGYPMYAASVAAAQRGRVVAAAVICSPTAEEWVATRGGGARLNGRPITVSRIDQLRPSLIGTGFPFKRIELMPRYLQQFDLVMRNTSGVRRAGAAAVDLCHVASGYFDGFWELDLNPWDYAAGSLMVEEAGGTITSINQDFTVLRPSGIIAGNPVIHDALSELLRPLL